MTDEEAEKERQKKAAEKCPKGFTYEFKETEDEVPFKMEACRMPMSYDLG